MQEMHAGFRPAPILCVEPLFFVNEPLQIVQQPLG